MVKILEVHKFGFDFRKSKDYETDQNQDHKGPFTNYICIFWIFLTTHAPSLHFLCSKLHCKDQSNILASQDFFSFYFSMLTLIVITLSGIAFRKQKLCVTLKYKQDKIDFTTFSKLTMCRASESEAWKIDSIKDQAWKV